jgi:anaerobic dimethyl sulfoxide reductase subunit B (iron-sulfur subunit)
LVVNLDRCIGCFACEVACKQEHQLPVGKHGIRVHTLGPFELWGNPAMDFCPMATEACDFCADRLAAGHRPFCAEVCPTQALSLCDYEGVLRLLRQGSRWQICKLQSQDER